MKELYLSKGSAKASQIDEDITLSIKRMLDDLDFCDNNKLVSAEQKRKQVALELENALKMPHYDKLGKVAMDILAEHAHHYLSADVYRKLYDDLMHTAKQLEGLKGADQEMPFLAMREISQASLDAIASVGLSRFSEGHYADSLAIFSFLTLLHPNEPSYWLRAGVAAHYDQQDTLALENYASALAIDPNYVEAYLFAADVCIKQGNKAEAAEYFNSAKELFNALENQSQSLKELFDDVERSLD